MPLIVAPCFPAYPSAPGTLSTAGQEVLERLHGPSGHDITFTTAAMAGMTLHYTAFKPIVDDISMRAYMAASISGSIRMGASAKAPRSASTCSSTTCGQSIRSCGRSQIKDLIPADASRRAASE